MGSVEIKQQYAPLRREVKICVDLPEYNTYKLRFEKEDKTNKKRVAIRCNNEYYTSDYKFKAKEPYILEIDSGFIGNICVESDGKDTLEFPVLDKGREEITLALVQPKEVVKNSSTNIQKKEEKFTKEDNLTPFKTTSEYFKNLGNEVQSITDEMRSEMILLFKENRNVVYGVIGDVSQEFSALKDGVWKDIKGLKFYIKDMGGKTYVILKGFAGLRETLKGTRYLLNNPQVAAFAVTAKDIVSWSSILNGTKITIFISSAFSLIDYFATKEGKADLTDIMVNLLTGIGKALVSYWAGVATSLSIVAGFALASIAVPAIAVFALGAIISIGVGIYLNAKDDESGWTTSLQSKVNEFQKNFELKINVIVDEEGITETMSFFEWFEKSIDIFINTGGYSHQYEQGY